MKKRIAQIVVGLPVEGPFDYSIGEEMQDRLNVGHRVGVLFNRRKRIGYVVGVKNRSSFRRLNPIIKILDTSPALDAKALHLTKALNQYYGCSWGEAIEVALPPCLRKSTSYEIAPADIRKSSPNKNKNIFLFDLTQTQRWPFIIDQITRCKDKNQSVLFLIPQMALCATVVKKLSERFANALYIWGEKTSSRDEFEQWKRIRSKESKIVIGTRSAIFAPVPRLGQIIVWEEQDYAYKQEQSPYYHARDVALMRAKIDQCSVVFISSAPSAEMWEKAKSNRYEKIVFQSTQSSVPQIIDMTNYNPSKTSILSFPLQNAIHEAINKKNKCLLLMNRRGFSTVTRCQECGASVRCERCNVNLIYMYSKEDLICPHCNFKMKLPKVCPQCQGTYMRSLGIGIEKLESEVARLYPHMKVCRFDKDTADVVPEADIIIATQAILKKKNSLSVGLIAVLDFDAFLNRNDFRSGQRAFSILVQLRQLAKDKLLIQTRMRDNYCLKAITKMNFNQFYRNELNLRKELGFPPYKHLAAITVRGKKEQEVLTQSEIIFSALKEEGLNEVEISDPHPDVIPKLRDQYRYTIMLKGKSVKIILSLWKKVLKAIRRKKSIIVTMNVDP